MADPGSEDYMSYLMGSDYSRTDSRKDRDFSGTGYSSSRTESRAERDYSEAGYSSSISNSTSRKERDFSGTGISGISSSTISRLNRKNKSLLCLIFLNTCWISKRFFSRIDQKCMCFCSDLFQTPPTEQERAGGLHFISSSRFFEGPVWLSLLSSWTSLLIRRFALKWLRIIRSVTLLKYFFHSLCMALCVIFQF